MTTAMNIEKKLKEQGINYEGYGILPKLAMQDPELSIEAKAIYAYFCAYAGNGNETSPARDKIIKDLNIGKERYYRHLNTLKKEEYISIYKIKQDNGYSKNVYNVNTIPKKFAESTSKDKLFWWVQSKDLKVAGYGIIPCSIMSDNRISIEAKALYAYFTTCADKNNIAYPSKSQILSHLGIGEYKYYTAINILIETNYITMEQIHCNGRLRHNEYILNSYPDKTNAQNKAEKKKNKKVVRLNSEIAEKLESYGES